LVLAGRNRESVVVGRPRDAAIGELRFHVEATPARGKPTPVEFKVQVIRLWSNLRTRSVMMLWTLAVILAVMWLLGMITSYTMGGIIHVLLVVAIVIIVVRLLQGRRPVI
jgi:hypothetical protein